MRRVRTPTVLQMEAVECGAASLGIILAHFGKWLPLEILRVDCNVSRDGSNAREIVMAARRYGLEAKGYRYSVKTLETIEPPYIAHWQFRHFLVVERVGRKHVHLNDPATGPRTVTRAEFGRSFTGLILKFKPTGAFQRSGRPPSTLRHAVPRLATAGWGVGMLLLLGLMLIVPGLVVPALTKIFVDEVLIKEAHDFVRPLILTLGVVIMTQMSMAWLQEWCLLRIESKLSLSGSARFLSHMLRLPAVFFTQRHPGDLVARLQANDQVARLFGGDLGRSFANFVGVLFFGGVMLMYDPVLAGLGMGIVGLSILGAAWAQRTLKDRSLKLETENGMLLGVTALGLRSIDNIKATGGEQESFIRWAGYHAKSNNTEQSLGRIANLVGLLPSGASGLATAVIFGVGSLRIADGMITVGGLVALHTLMQSFTQPFSGLVQFMNKLQSAGAALTRVQDVLNHPPAPDYRRRETVDAPVDRLRLTGHIELRNVTFGYSRNQPPLVENLNLVIEPGTRVALVGRSGSGKSTVAKLIIGLMEPWNGEILLDGRPVAEIPPALRRASIGWVAQDVYLFQGTISENLTLWDATIPLDVITRAAKDAEIHALITSRPGGYEAPIREGGANVSGGEAQRLEIARTLAQEPTILVLDEATSALDPKVEMAIDRHIRKRGLTSLIVAHCLSTIRDAEQILVLENGKVVESGTHDALMQAEGRYRNLVEN